MGPDDHTPNYQASPAHPGDDSVVLNQASKMPQIAIPPRRLGYGISTKIKLNRVSALEPESVNREIPLPVTSAPSSKRSRVNEISPQSPFEQRMQKTPHEVYKKRLKWDPDRLHGRRRRGIRGEKAISSHANNPHVTRNWIICAGALVIAIVVGAISLSVFSKDESEIAKVSIYKEIKQEVAQKESMSEREQLLSELFDGEDQAKKIFAKYATSRSVDDFIDTIYLSDKNRNLISKIWEPMDVEPGWEPNKFCTWTVDEDADAQFGILSGMLADLSGFTAIFRKEGDSMKMDWRATTAHSSADYSALMKGEGDTKEIRAILSPDDFHTFTLPEGVYRCYKLSSPNRMANIWAYTKLRSVIDQKLISQFTPGQLIGEVSSEIPVVLVLARGSAEFLPNQWIISKVVRLSWLDE